MISETDKNEALQKVQECYDKLLVEKGVETAYDECNIACAFIDKLKITEEDWVKLGKEVITPLMIHDAAIMSLRKLEALENAKHLKLRESRWKYSRRLKASNGYLHQIAEQINTLNLRKQRFAGCIPVLPPEPSIPVE